MKWEEIKDVPLSKVQTNNAETAFTVTYTLKPDVLPTMITDDTTGTVWFLEVQAQMEGLDYKMLFEIPVFTSANDLKNVIIENAINRALRMITLPIVFITMTILIVFSIIAVLSNPNVPAVVGVTG